MSWSLPPSLLRLVPEEVDVWRARLELAPAALENLRLTLSPDEAERAARRRLPEAQDRFAGARGILRDILGRYLDREPSTLVFGYRPRGKPFLASPAAAEGLEFNLSHSHGMLLCGVARGRQVGVDVEKVRPGVDCQRIAERFFSPRESAAILSLPPERRAERFFRCWSCKEAYVKAGGEGLAIPLDSFEVAFAPGEPPALLRVEGNSSEVERWQVTELEPAPGYAAAIVTEGDGPRLRLWDWKPKS
jgi:4'-phosphopantetheinyl transferase